jgi:hypothetical protein
VDIFGLVSWSLAVVVSVTLLWPLNILLLALAYRVRQSGKKGGLRGSELWWRSSLAATSLALLSAVLLGLTYSLVELAELRAGPVQLALLVAYLPAAVGLVFWMLALEDMLQGLSVFLLYILLPGLPLLLAGRITGLWEWLRRSAPWLLLPTS